MNEPGIFFGILPPESLSDQKLVGYLNAGQKSYKTRLLLLSVDLLTPLPWLACEIKVAYKISDCENFNQKMKFKYIRYKKVVILWRNQFFLCFSIIIFEV